MAAARFTPEVRNADIPSVPASTRISLQLAVAGAGLVVLALHGAGTSSGQGGRSAADLTAQVTSPSPAAPPSPVAIHVAAHPMVRVVARKPSPHRQVAHASAHRSPAHRSPVRRTAARRAVHRPALTFTAALMKQVARIPTYHPGQARWVVSRAYDFWGTADWYHDVLYVSPDVPRNRLYDVAVHEWSHELSVLDYAGDVDTATAAMNAWFGGKGLVGAERAADCMAILQGATWTHYTTCTNSLWRQGAAKLVAGKPL